MEEEKKDSNKEINKEIESFKKIIDKLQKENSKMYKTLIEKDNLLEKITKEKENEINKKAFESEQTLREHTEKLKIQNQELLEKLENQEREYNSNLIDLKLENQAVGILVNNGVHEKAMPYVLKQLKKSISSIEENTIKFKDENGAPLYIDGQEATLDKIIDNFKKENDFFFKPQEKRVSLEIDENEMLKNENKDELSIADKFAS